MKKQAKSYRYTLERCTGNRKKSICPNCGHRTFVRYIDVETGKPLGEDIGRCDREINCGYHKKPRDFFSEHLHTSQRRYWFPKKEYREPSDTSIFSTIDPAKVEQTVMLGAFNNFSIWLREHFGFTEAMQQMMRYRIGTSNHWPNATIFWQIDQQQKVHTGKIMLYDYHSGHRVKDPYNHIAWVHKSENARNFHLKQCLFGLHLLRPDTQIVAIVEAEKTAVVASIFFPGVLFLATGGLQNLNAERCAPLKGHRVILFPDLGAEDKWREKAVKIPALKGCIISTWLANHASAVERERGLDLADYLEGLDARCKLRVEDFVE